MEWIELRRLRSRDPLQRALAVRRLASGGSLGVEPLIETLGDEDSRVRSAAVDALGALGAAEAVPALAALVQHDENTVVVWNCIRALGSIGGPAAGVLAEATRHADPEARYRALCELRRLRAYLSVPILAPCLKDEAANVRKEAIDSLWMIGGAEAASALAEALDDPEPALRALAAQRLGQIGEAQSVPGLAARLGDGDPAVRREAIVALSRIAQRVHPAASTHDAAAVGALGQALSDPDPALRAVAVQGLGFVQRPESALALAARLGDDDPSVRTAALGALLSLPRDATVLVLEEAAQGHDAALRAAVALALGALNCQEAMPALMALLDDEDAAVRRSAVGALASTSAPQAAGPQAAPALAARLQDADASVRAKAAQALIPMVSIGAVLHHLVEALGSGSRARAVPALVALLDDRNASVRTLAAEALGRIGDRAATGPLIRLLETGQSGPTDRLAAVLALALIGDHEAVGALVDLARPGRTDTDTGRAAAAAVAELEQSQPQMVRLHRAILEAAAWTHTHNSASDAEFARARGQFAATMSEAGCGGADVLVGALRFRERIVREAALEALRSLQWSPPDVEGKLYLCLARGDYEALTEVGEEVTPLLVAELDDPESGVRDLAARALGRIGGPDAYAELVRVFRACPGDRYEHWRGEGLAMLGRDGIAVLADAVCDENGPVTRREVAVHGLGHVGPEYARDPLVVGALTAAVGAGMDYVVVLALGRLGWPLSDKELAGVIAPAFERLMGSKSNDPGGRLFVGGLSGSSIPPEVLSLAVAALQVRVVEHHSGAGDDDWTYRDSETEDLDHGLNAVRALCRLQGFWVAYFLRLVATMPDVDMALRDAHVGVASSHGPVHGIDFAPRRRLAAEELKRREAQPRRDPAAAAARVSQAEAWRDRARAKGQSDEQIEAGLRRAGWSDQAARALVRGPEG